MEDEVNKIIYSLEEHQSVAMMSRDENIEVRLVELDVLNDILNMDDFVFSLCLLDRAGCRLYQQYLELKYFSPKSSMNELLLCFYHKWGGMVWSIVGIPDENNGEEKMLDAIEYADLKIADGAPTMISSKIETIGLCMKNMICLENKPGSLFYTDKLLAFENEQKSLQIVQELYLPEGNL